MLIQFDTTSYGSHLLDMQMSTPLEPRCFTIPYYLVAHFRPPFFIYLQYTPAVLFTDFNIHQPQNPVKPPMSHYNELVDNNYIVLYL